MAIPLLVRKNFADLVEEKVTLLSLAADPVNSVKPLWFIQDYYEEEHSNRLAYDVRRLPLPHRFLPFPTPLVSWRFITISINALTPFLFPGRLVKGYWNQLEQFCKVFNFKKLGFRSVAELKTNTSVLFWNLIRSDGFTVDFLFKDAVIDHHDLTLEDFSYEEITANYRPTFVDPGRKTVFTAAIG
ncbi:hypothetical protein BDF20DRAFT_885223, partial [Mycotypha africana]|uniref:uncharacterized protein n=1 Tax=Mycotypha africana TaxID=64632 RepID=UPI00230099DD